MYSFETLGGDNVSLRPEGTAGVVRACEQHQLLYGAQPRLWYTGPMFRYEKPQKGRLRQFHQFGVEVFGLNGPDIDAEMLVMTARLWRALGIADAVTLQIKFTGHLRIPGQAPHGTAGVFATAPGAVGRRQQAPSGNQSAAHIGQQKPANPGIVGTSSQFAGLYG